MIKNQPGCSRPFAAVILMAEEIYVEREMSRITGCLACLTVGDAWT
jgi:hypothetical protein